MNTMGKKIHFLERKYKQSEQFCSLICSLQKRKKEDLSYPFVYSIMLTSQYPRILPPIFMSPIKLFNLEIISNRMNSFNKKIYNLNIGYLSNAETLNAIS